MKLELRIEAALAYAAAGLHVFPAHSVESGQCSCGNPNCRNKGKHSRTPNGLKDATIDTRQVKSWWEAFPNANIGIRTGKESGIFVVDIDGPDGFQWLHQQPFARPPWSEPVVEVFMCSSGIPPTGKSRIPRRRSPPR